MPQSWQVVDIGAFTARVSGDTASVAYDNDFLGFVSSQEVNGSLRLLFLDPRSDASHTTRGCGGLFIGQVFDPDVEIAEIL